MQIKITQISKNDEGTGLSNILSYMYQQKNTKETIEIFFDTNEGTKSLKLSWKVKKGSDGSIQKGYSYIIPKTVSSTNQDAEFFSTTQDLFLPAIQSTLYQMGFKDSTIKNVVRDKREETSIDDIFDLGDDFNDDIKVEKDTGQLQFNFDDLEKESSKASYKLGVIEVLHRLFNKNNGNEVLFPREDIKYERVTAKKKEFHHENIKKVHKFKTLMGDKLVDSPNEILTSLTISSSTFNVLAKGHQNIVLELKDGRKIQTQQVRDKVLINEGSVKVPFLYAKLTKELFNILSSNTNKLLDDTSYYDQNKFYKVRLLDSKDSGFSFDNEDENGVSLVNEKILKIPQEEIVNLVYDIEVLKVRQSVYNAKIKELKSTLNIHETFDSTSYQGDSLEFRELGIRSGYYTPVFRELDSRLGYCTPVSEENDETKKSGKVKTKQNIDISVFKFPKTSIQKEEQILLDKVLGQVNLGDPKKLELVIKGLEKKLKGIKNSLAEKRYKLSLLSNMFFLKGFSELLNYTGQELLPTKAKGVVGGVKKSKFFQNKTGSRTVRVQLFTTEEEL